MNSHFYQIECVLCHKKTTEKETTSVCLSCGGPLDILYDYDHLKDQINSYILITDFNVEIPTTGSHATVEVTMVLEASDGTQVVEKGTSPDIIVASIEAYEKGYNELVWQRNKKYSQI